MIRDYIDSNDLEGVKKWIDEGHDINAQMEGYNYNPLQHACRFKDVDMEIIKTLLHAKSKVNLKNDLGYTALSLAAETGRVDIMDKNGFSPLMRAVCTNQLDSVRYLLAHHADLELKSKGQESTALMLATQRKHIEMIKVLIEAGAEVDTMQKDLWSPIMHAASREDEELVHILLEAGSVDMDDALCESFRLENINISGKLMDAGAQIDSI